MDTGHEEVAVAVVVAVEDKVREKQKERKACRRMNGKPGALLPARTPCLS